MRAVNPSPRSDPVVWGDTVLAPAAKEYRWPSEVMAWEPDLGLSQEQQNIVGWLPKWKLWKWIWGFKCILKKTFVVETNKCFVVIEDSNIPIYQWLYLSLYKFDRFAACVAVCWWKPCSTGSRCGVCWSQGLTALSMLQFPKLVNKGNPHVFSSNLTQPHSSLNSNLRGRCFDSNPNPL